MYAGMTGGGITQFSSRLVGEDARASGMTGGRVTQFSSSLVGEDVRAPGLYCDGKACAEGVAASGVRPGTTWGITGG
jgi:hypothetical protein